MALTHALATNNYGPAKFIVATNAANGTHTTFAGAMADASAGDTIFIRDSITENVTITPGVNVTAWSGGSLNTPSVTGTLTMTGAGTSTISGLELITNSAALIAVTGSAASILNVNNCYLNCSNNTGITFSTSSPSAAINISHCFGNLGTTGIALFSHSSAGTLLFECCNFSNSGGSSTANTVSAGACRLLYTEFSNPFTSSSTGILNADVTVVNCTGQNTTAWTIGGSGNSSVFFSYFLSGTASAMNISTAINIQSSTMSSSNTNAITGSGTITYSGLTYSNTSSTNNVTTQSGGTLQGSKNTAPSAGFLGEQIRNAATAVALITATPANIASISLTPGVWDISCVFRGNSSTLSITTCACGISINTGSFTGTVVGDSQVTMNSSALLAITYSMAIPCFRAVLTTTTTYFLVGQVNAAGTVTGDGRISATRVG